MEYIWKQLRRTETIDGAFDSWRLYRDNLTRYILDSVSDYESIALFGVGQSNDIDLTTLENNFNQVILLDRDLQAMKEGLKQYQLEASTKIKILECDFLGITNEEYCRYEEVIRAAFLKHKEIQQIENIVLDELYAMIRKIEYHKLDLGTYANVILIGVHSQLNALFERIWSIYAQAFKQNSNKIYEFIKQMNAMAVCKLNNAVIASTQHKLILGYERTVAGKSSRVEGAIQAEYDIIQRQNNGEIMVTDSKKLEWPFYQQSIYDMLILTIEKNK